jgi:hypothetical protein
MLGSSKWSLHLLRSKFICSVLLNLVPFNYVVAGYGSRAVYGMHSLRSLGSRDLGFESHSEHGCLVFVCVCVRFSVFVYR